MGTVERWSDGPVDRSRQTFALRDIIAELVASLRRSQAPTPAPYRRSETVTTTTTTITSTTHTTEGWAP